MNITELQSKLYEYSKKNVDKKAQVYNLIYQNDNLLYAYDLVRQNKGALTAGVDGITFATFQISDLEQLGKDLRRQEYTPSPVLQVEIPKPNGGIRKLGIPTFRDRVAQKAALNMVEPILETKFQEFVVGFRPRINRWHGLSDLRFLVTPRYVGGNLRNSYKLCIINDISAAFDNINKSAVQTRLERYFADNRLKSLIMSWMGAEIHFKDEVMYPDGGTPQGGVISPLLFNLALMDLDEWFLRNFSPLKFSDSRTKSTFNNRRLKSELGGVRYIRYADDFIMPFTGSIQVADELINGHWADLLPKRDPLNLDKDLDFRNLSEVIKPLGLLLKVEKSQVAHITEGIDFLGIRTIGVKKPNSRYVVHQYPLEKKIAFYKEKIIKITIPSNKPDWDVIERLNQQIRGFAYANRHGNVSLIYKRLQRFTFMRAFRYLAKKHKLGLKTAHRRFLHYVDNPRIPKGSDPDKVKPKVLRLLVPIGENKWKQLVDMTDVHIVYLTLKVPFNLPNPYEFPIYLKPKETYVGRTIYGDSWLEARKLALQRDEYTCALCQTAFALEVHHILPFGSLEMDIVRARMEAIDKKTELIYNRLENLITLCRYCHNDQHRTPNFGVSVKEMKNGILRNTFQYDTENE